MQTYFKITCDFGDGESPGYEGLFGDAARYHWTRGAAEAVAERLASQSDRDGLGYLYGVQERQVYDSGPFDDAADEYAVRQLFAKDPHGAARAGCTVDAIVEAMDPDYVRDWPEAALGWARQLRDQYASR